MGVEYRRYTIPRPNSFLPEASQLVSFLETAAQWLRYPGWVARRAEGMRLTRQGATVAEAIAMLDQLWGTGIRARWPFRWPDREYAYDLEIQVSPRDYIHHISETVAPFQSATCLKCGGQLSYDAENDIFQEGRIQAVCPRCGEFFDPSNLPATFTDGWTGEKSTQLGGATYRFALIIDNVPLEEWEHFRVDPEFIALAKKAFACDFYSVNDIS